MKPPAPTRHPLRDALAPVVSNPARRAAPAIGRYANEIFSELARRTRFVDPNLAVDWPRVVGTELAGLCRPGRLSGGRLGRSLEVFAASGAAASRVQFEAETLRRKVNEYLGPGVVVRIVVRRAAEAADTRLESALGRFRAAVKARSGKE